jgi:hypothetical protein
MYRVFIPFIHEEFRYSSIITKLEETGLCEVKSLNVHEKKELKKNGTLRSLKHYYAFLEIVPKQDCAAGRNLEENLKENKNTHVIHDNDPSKYWIIKPYMTIEDRLSKGFSLLNSKNQQEQKNQDWMNIDCDELLCLEDFPMLPTIRRKDYLGKTKEAFPKCLEFLDSSIMYSVVAQRANSRKSYFDDWKEKEMIRKDYETLEKDMNVVISFMQFAT